MAQDSKIGWKPSNTLTQTVAVFSVAALTALAPGCEKKLSSVLTPNLRPFVELSVAPLPEDSVFYSVRFEWFASDEDGQVLIYLYAVDPPALGDTAWVSYRSSTLLLSFRSGNPRLPLPEAGSVVSSDFHVFVLKAVDNEGLESPPVFRAFTSYTVAPQTQIQEPVANRLIATRTAPAFIIRWSGVDPDGVTTEQPISYRFKMVSQATIQLALGLGNQVPRAAEIQEFFSEDAPIFAAWDSAPPESTFVQFEGLTPGQTFFFAVVAFDEAGAYEPRFLIGNNVLQVLPSVDVLGPRITLFNSFFSKTGFPGFDLSERLVARLTLLAGEPFDLNWFAEPGAPGTTVTGFRWVLNPLGGDIFDETPRRNDSETFRWSTWSISELATVVGPFSAEPGIDTFHRFYVEARDNVGQVSILILEIRIIEPRFDRPMLIYDDFRGTPDRLVNLADPDDPRNNQPAGSFPTEAVLDTLLYAVGGKPYKFRPQGTLSDPGVFAGFDYDTLDHRFILADDIPLSLLSRYRVLVLYTGAFDAAREEGLRSGIKTSALRYLSAPGRLNTIAVFLARGGKVWLFGDGILRAIGQGNLISRPSPGSFLHDFLKIQSQVTEGGKSFFKTDRFLGATSYLPTSVTPGWTWPPAPGGPARGECDDPRVGPSSSRHVGRWGGLPCLTFTTEFPDWPTATPTELVGVPYLALPNSILEDHDMDFETPAESRLDTLYLYRARNFKLSASPTNPDGKPIMFSYWGDDHGAIVWTGLPLWVFERTQLQVLAEKVLNGFGLSRKPDPSTWTGPGSAHVVDPRAQQMEQ